MKKNICVMIIVVVLLGVFCTCSSGGDDLEIDFEETSLSGTLTIDCYFDYGMQFVADYFMKQHPDVTIEVVDHSRSSDTIYGNIAEYNTKIATELLSGSCKGIIDVGAVTKFKFAKSGLFCDLYDFMEQDPDFKKEDYFENIFEALEYKDQLFYLANSAQVLTLRGNMDMLQEGMLPDYGVLTSDMVIEVYERVSPDFEDLHVFSTKASEIFEPTNRHLYLDTKTETAYFDTPEFIDYLALQKQYNTMPENNEPYLFEFYLTNMNSITEKNSMETIFDKDDGYSAPLLFGDRNGNVGFQTRNLLAIPASVDNKRLAWEFLKCYIGEKDLADFNSIYQISLMMPELPINKYNCLKYFDYEGIQAQNTKGEAVTNASDWVMDVISVIDHHEEQNGELLSAILEPYDQFLNGILTAEEAANQMQERATLFFGE